MTAGAPTAQATGQRRRRRAVPLPTSTTANDCVALVVDTAANSGWAITLRGRVIDSGEVKALRHKALVDLCLRARNVAFAEGLPKTAIVLVLEKPWRAPRGGRNGRDQHAVVQGLGGAVHAWRSAWCEAFETLNPHRVVTVTADTWRRRILGFTSGSGLPAAEQRTAREVLAGLHAERDLGADEAAALCISRWAAHCGEVAAKLSKGKHA